MSCWHAVTQIYRIGVAAADTSITQITKGVHDYGFVALANDKLIGVKHSMSKPDEIYSIDPKTGAETELSFENKAILDQLKMGKVEEARAQYQRAATQFPEAADPVFNLAVLAWKEEKWSVVVEELEEVLRRNPNHLQARAHLEDAKKRLRDVTP